MQTATSFRNSSKVDLVDDTVMTQNHKKAENWCVISLVSSVCVSILYACRGCYNALAACVGMFGSCWHYLRGYSLGGAAWWYVRSVGVFVVSVAG